MARKVNEISLLHEWYLKGEKTYYHFPHPKCPSSSHTCNKNKQTKHEESIINYFNQSVHNTEVLKDTGKTVLMDK